MRDAGNENGLRRLEVIRKLNGENREWANSELYRLMYKQDLYILAYERIKSHPGNMTPGTGDETLDGFSLAMIDELIQEMRTERYHCKPVRTAYIPKSNGKMRKLGIPCTRDKIVQEVVRLILETIYLHELDVFVEQVQKEPGKGELRRPNPEYRSVQKRRQCLAKTGKSGTREYRELGVLMRKLPSLDPQDPNFVRVKYCRYADDWLIGVTGPHQLAEEIKERIVQFLKSRLSLTLSTQKTLITQPQTQKADIPPY